MPAYQLPSDYKNPPLMAIGDSMYQGVRSLTMSAPLFRQSPPAQVARALGLGPAVFAGPDPERPILIDMEAFIRLLPDLSAINDQVAKNAAYWTRTPLSPSGRLTFENAAVASMDITDLYDFDWDLRMRQADALTVATASSLRALATAKIPDGSIGDAILGLNARYTLNPAGRSDLEGIQPVDLVKIREPETLLVNIGSNEGLFHAGFEAQAALTEDSVREITKKYEKLAGHLREVGPGTRRMVFNTLVLPSQVPNLMPAPESVTYDGIPPGPDGYFDLYENRMGFGYGTLTGAQMKQQDKLVRALNATMIEVMRRELGDRAVFVDLAEQMAHLDRKHQGLTKTNAIKVVRRRWGIFPDTSYITNMMLEEGLGNAFKWGGFCGLDGMHPSVVGYGKIANEVLTAMGATGRRVTYNRCFREDTLLSDLPWLWTELMFLYRDYRKLKSRLKDKSDQVKVETLSVAALTAPSSKGMA
ncbi:hypothetical protein [Rhodospira trueperi]|uniref:GDSL-like Lipase/Acylhydrolase n=1 Tax=Rhodospira trueperi TaxID=69960 RepID=A0A1G7CD87_9PROT|nr:hypothetical protein [Rhodospira trueperi]SDE36700.1 GDSL-like Lipase/Acylhydrolase [Rhodospira trueperi]